ncbi:MAG: hypothetical protein HJJLKODD_01831 [Phycisphaerae bacterium]|nr:hypothetical protein [Phycisphaerae bacterium]
MDIAALANQATGSSGTTERTGFEGLGSNDFFKLIITQLLQQDPLKPTDNQQLLQQISTIREMEMNQGLSDSLRTLMEQQRFGSASTLLGQYVESNIALDSTGSNFAQGLVVGVRFGADGQAILQLDDGNNVPLSRLTSVTSLQQKAQSLVGQMIQAHIMEAGESQPVDGVVTEAKQIDGQWILELDNGKQVPILAVESSAPATPV